jgi:hypothetical protein
MHPIADLIRPAAGEPCWLVQCGYGSFVTMEFGDPQVEIGRPKLMPVDIDGAPERTLKRSAFVHGDSHLWIYCCRWSITLEGRQLAHNESDDITMNRALAVLNGQILTAVEIGPDSRTAFSFDLGCMLLTYPAPAGTYDNEPVEQWLWYSGAGQVATVRGDGTYSLTQRDTIPEEERWQPITTPVRVSAAT